MENTAPQPAPQGAPPQTAAPSPFAAPAQATPVIPEPPPIASPFAAPAQTAPAPAAQNAADTGDTSYLDDVSAREPLIKPCTVPGVVTALAAKTSSTGNPFLSISVQLYGEKMVFENGDPVGMGKRLTSSVFASSKTDEGLKRTGRQLKNLLLALHNVPLDGKEDAAYKGWPPAQKIGLVPAAAGAAFSLAAFEPGDRWTGTKVMVEVRAGKDMDGARRNEFNLLAASTKPVERKPRS